jgi:hypothetical protein
LNKFGKKAANALNESTLKKPLFPSFSALSAGERKLVPGDEHVCGKAALSFFIQVGLHSLTTSLGAFFFFLILKQGPGVRIVVVMTYFGSDILARIYRSDYVGWPALDSSLIECIFGLNLYNVLF